MSFTKWLRRLPSYCRFGTTNRKSRRAARCEAPKRARLQLESLEDRCVPSAYTVTDLGTLGGYYSFATDVNETGQVVGSSDTWEGFQHAFLWDNGTMIDLGTLGGNWSWAEGVNDLGQVVGSAYLAGDTAIHGFLVDPQGGTWFQDNDFDGRNDLMIDLGELGASDINNAGQVVGSYYTTDGYTHAILWDATNGMTDLGTPTGFDDSWANGVNASGQVVGAAQYYDEQTGWRSSAFLWDAANGMTALGAGTGYTDSNATSINDAGKVVGVQWDAIWGSYSFAFLWTPGTPNGFTDLGVLPAGFDSNATDINNAGQVVGGSTVEVGWDGIPHAFVWDGGMNDLQDQVVPGSGATLQGAQAINDTRAIAANGLNSSSESRAFLLTPTADIPTIRIADAPAVYEGNTGTLTVEFAVTLSVASTQAVSVSFTTASGTATGGSDYRFTNGMLTFAPGETSKSIAVQIIGDRAPESNENFYVQLYNPTNAFIADDTGEGIIKDDEPRISIGDVTKAEGNNGRTLFVFTVTLSVPGSLSGYDQAVSMLYTTNNGTAKKGEDYTASSGTLTFLPGETTKTITIEVKGDAKKEGNENFFVDLSSLSSYAEFLDSRGTGTILNDD